MHEGMVGDMEIQVILSASYQALLRQDLLIKVKPKIEKSEDFLKKEKGCKEPNHRH